ncbi:MAG: hypothetical protein WAO35_00900 [Terriglobia bacterium]
MALTNSQKEMDRRAAASPATSHGLQWLWQHLSHLRHPDCLDCGPICQSTLDVLLLRGAKLYLSDLITPIQQSPADFWSRQTKTTVFLVDDFLAQIPPIPPDSLSLICCWGLLDMLPREALPKLVARFHSYLQPSGVLFSILREPHVGTGAHTRWWFESLTALGSSDTSQKPFLYPSLTNREMERLFPGGDVKTFLTRFGRREVLAVK